MQHLIEDCVVEYTFNWCIKGYIRSYLKKKSMNCIIGSEGMILSPNFFHCADKIFCALKKFS